jgi:signal transduction histidine kinase
MPRFASVPPVLGVRVTGSRACSGASLCCKEQLREATVAQDRDRFAASLQDEVIQRIFAAGLSMGSPRP